MKIRVFDVETTGLGSSAKVVEAGYHDLTLQNGTWEITRVTSAVFNVHALGIRCEETAQRIHGIQDDEIDKGYPYEWLDPKFITYGDPDMYAAHNLKFDSKFFKLTKPAICTLECARYLWKGAPSYKNGELGVWKGISDDVRLHRVIPDTKVTAGLLFLMLTEDKKAPEELLRITQGKTRGSAGIATGETMPSGQHAGKSFNAIPTHYLKWLANESNFRDSVKASARAELIKRNA